MAEGSSDISGNSTDCKRWGKTDEENWHACDVGVLNSTVTHL